ncbi:efflux RND transporter periplasmic adaptor subunit [Leadbetterella byssophila]|uniref:Efflux transporter, RND family, MFP subunit n=1 Tax=Leadbetterella byssophila (strain DSM 17132 / JCM 16389 / KACC 11308 / NBRC 106382 / 4M15) TaxID=649349 RepID=E4RWG9_LEAB4|nr:efflux RND transporter periplasmic adaptor subunit [Leadbetterella byssophila]ADQ18042.1 efflux transporter, RND family, MFP subunit [Leadbetterella byssophila DSM 17132]
MDKAITQNRKPSRYIKYLGALILVFGAYWVLRQSLLPTVKRTDLVFGEVKSGGMVNTISATGLVEPSTEIVLISPLATKVKQILKDNGSEVKVGDPILLLDTQFADMEFRRLTDELSLKENNVLRLRLELEKNIREIELDDQVKDLQVKNLEAQVKDALRLKSIGGMTQEEVDQARQNLAIALLEKKKLENELKYRKESIASSVKGEELQSSIQRQRRDELAQKIQKATLRAEVDGVVTWIENRIGAQVQEGDPLAKLANLSAYSLMVQVSDMHADKIQVGQEVQVELNQKVEKGEIEQILPAIENNTIQCKVRLMNTGSESLRPKMRVPVRIVTQTRQESKFLPMGPGIKGGRSQELFVVNGSEAKKRVVELGFRTSDKVEVISGLQPGDQVIISDMSLFEDKSRVKIK